jgi:hypothetical protein
MNPAFWLLAVGFLVALAMIALVHKLEPHYKPDGTEKTKDRIWILEKVSFGVVVVIIVLSHVKELFRIFQGEHPSDDMEKAVWITVGALLASASLLLAARFLDGIFGDE